MKNVEDILPVHATYVYICCTIKGGITTDFYKKWIGDHVDPCIDLMNTNIHWKSFKVAHKKSSFPLNIFVTKWISGDTATGMNTIQRKQRDSSEFLRCNYEDENLIYGLT